MKQIIGIEIPRRNPLCTKGQEPFQPGVPYLSFLTESPKGLVRSDFCEKCWGSDLPAGSVAEWRGRVPLKTEKQAPVNRNERALELLKLALHEQNKEEAFILGLYLARNRVLALRKEATINNLQVNLYEDPNTEEFYPIPKLSLSQIQTNAIQETLAKKFQDG